MPVLDQGQEGRRTPSADPEGAGPDDDQGVGLAELAEGGEGPGDDALRRQVEDDVEAEITAALEDQAGRVADAAQARGAALVEDEAFWSAERVALAATLLPVLLGALNRLGPAAVITLETSVGATAWPEVAGDAAAWAREHAGALITQISETTRRDVGEAVAAWIESGEELAALERALTPTFGRDRAQMIAQTETTRAYGAANNLARQSVGLPATAWAEPAHVRCRCWTRPERLPNGAWVIVWSTAEDDKVCRRPIATPWGQAAGCRGLDNIIVSANYLGRKLKDVRAEVSG
jgi:hypothetical protein